MDRYINKKENYTLVEQDRTRILINFDMQDAPTEGYCTYAQAVFNKKQHPDLSIDTVKEAILAQINDDVKANIITGFSWDGHPVWLSIENQTNYKSAYDLAIQTEGDTLPYVIRVGADDSAPDYIRFNNRSDFADFYRAMVSHIQQCLANGWQLKDSIEWDRYEQALATL